MTSKKFLPLKEKIIFMEDLEVLLTPIYLDFSKEQFKYKYE